MQVYIKEIPWKQVEESITLKLENINYILKKIKYNLNENIKPK